MANKLLTKKLAILLTMFSLSAGIQAAGGGDTLSANIDPRDTISLQRGAQTYMNYCLACHSMQYMRYSTLVEKLEIPEEIVEQNLQFTGEKVSDYITNNVPERDAQNWFGKAPPDLTLSARVRGADWLYTYLISFYEDQNRPFGVNNSLFKDVGMPHVLAPLQGKQVKTSAAQEIEAKIAAATLAIGAADQAGDSATVDAQTAILEEAEAALADLKADGQYFAIAEAGSLSPEEYDTLVRDLVNFMDFAGEPGKVERQDLGVKVILFLLLFFVLSYFLKQEYWKDIH